MFTMTLSNGKTTDVPRAFLKGSEHMPKEFLETIARNFGTNTQDVGTVTNN
jgi:hypothetical protein